MWHSGSKYQRIRALVKASHKWLKLVLVLGVKNFGPTSIASKLVEFPLINNFFPNLAKFRDLNIFLLFNFLKLNNFLDFLACCISFLLIPNLLILLSPLFFPEAGLLLLFLLKADLLPSFLLEAGLLDNLVIFSIEMSGAIILLKP